MKESFKLMLHRIHLLAHVQDDFHSGKIHTKIASERQNHFKPFKIRISVKPRVPFGARRLQQPFPFVKAQRLRMQFELLRDGADGVGFGSTFHKSCASYFVLCSSLSVPR